MLFRSALNYNILHGAVKGHCNFNIEFGENCIIANSNPLGDIKLITDMQPTGDQSPLVNVSAAFMFPINQVFELEEVRADNTVIVRRFQPFIKRYQLFKMQGSSKIPVNDVFQQLEQEGAIGILKHSSALEAQTNYFSEIEVQVNEVTTGSPVLVMKPGTSTPASEVRNVTFKTGDRPQALVDIVDAWPIQNQRFFLQNEGLEPAVQLSNGGDDVNNNPPSVGKKGYVKIGQQDYLFKGIYAAAPPSTTMVRASVVYEAVFIPSDGSAVLRTPMKYFDNERAVEFDIPQLANSTIYKLEIVRTMSGGVMASTSGMTLAQTTDTRTFDVVEKSTGRVVTVGDKSTAIITKNILSGSSSSSAVPPIMTLFSYQFRTSKFNNHREKFAGALLLANNNTSGMVRNWQMTTDESFETIDISNSEANLYHNNQTPLIQTFLPDIQNSLTPTHTKFSFYRTLENQYFAKFPSGYFYTPDIPISPYYATSGLLGLMSPPPPPTSGLGLTAAFANIATSLQSQSLSISTGGAVVQTRPTMIINDITDRSLYRRFDIMAKKIYVQKIGTVTVQTVEYGDALNAYKFNLGTFGQQRIKFVYWVPTKAGSYSTAPIQFETTVRGGGN